MSIAWRIPKISERVINMTALPRRLHSPACETARLSAALCVAACPVSFSFDCRRQIKLTFGTCLRSRALSSPHRSASNGK